MKNPYWEGYLFSSAGSLEQEFIEIPPETRTVHYSIIQFGADDDPALCRLVMLAPTNYQAPGAVAIEGLDVFSQILRTAESGNAIMEGACLIQPGTKRLRWDLQNTNDGGAALALSFSPEKNTTYQGGKVWYTSRAAGSAEANIFQPVPQSCKVFDVNLFLPLAGVIPVQHVVEDWYIYPRTGLISTSGFAIGTLGTNVAPQTVTQNRYTGRVTPHYFRVRMTANAGAVTEFIQQFNFWETF